MSVAHKYMKPTASQVEAQIKAVTHVPTGHKNGRDEYVLTVELKNGISETFTFYQGHVYSFNEHKAAARTECVKRLCERLTLDELNAPVAKPKQITKKQIDERVSRIEYLRLPNSTVTICHITLDNGFSVRGESACIDPAAFDEEYGKQLAYDEAFEKLFQLFGFLEMEAANGALSYVKPGQ